MVISPLETFWLNCRNDLLLNQMLAVFAGDELELVVIPVILDNFTRRLCLPCWVCWVVSWLGRFLVGGQ